MSEAAPAAPAAPAPPAAPPPPKLAGKYDTPDQLGQGIRELAKQIELPLAEDRPTIGEKGHFGDVDEAVAAYKAMQRIYTRNQQQSGAAPETPPVTPPADDKKADQPVDGLKIPEPKPPTPPVADEDATIEQVLTKANLKAEDLATAWQANGKLTDEQYAALKAQGYPKTVVNTFLASQATAAQAAVAQQQAIATEAATITGGKEQLTNLLQWAATLPPAEQADLNRRLGDPALWKGALTQLQASHARAVGASGSQPLINGNGSASGGTAPITTQADYFKTLHAAAAGDPTATARMRAYVAAKAAGTAPKFI